MDSKIVPDWEPVLRYRRFMREFDNQRNVKVGLQLFLAGIGLVALALAVFVGSYAFTSGSEFLTWGQFAYALSMLAVPVVVLSIAVLLQPDRETLRIAVGGVGVTGVATIAFLLAYPKHWYGYGNDYTLYVVGLYAIGLAAVTYVMGVSLKRHAPQLIQTLTEIRPPEPYDSTDSGGASNAGGSAGASSTGGSDGSSRSGTSPGADGPADGSADASSSPDAAGAGGSGSAVAATTDDTTDSSGSAEAAGETRVIANPESIADEDESGDAPSEVTLVVDGERYAFGDGDTFGRQDAEWLEDLGNACGGPEETRYVSEDHLAFAAKDDGVYVTGQGRNGTELNGETIDDTEAKLEDGDTLVLADRAEIDVEL